MSIGAKKALDLADIWDLLSNLHHTQIGGDAIEPATIHNRNVLLLCSFVMGHVASLNKQRLARNIAI